MKPLREAQRQVLEAVPQLPTVDLPLADAVGLALASSIVTTHDIPPFSNSAMDGYAVRAEDVATTPTRLSVVEDVPAGSVPQFKVEIGTAIKIMTGAPLPEGADAVVKVEDTEPDGDHVTILSGVPKGTSVRPAGGDLPAGAVALEAGTRLSSVDIGLAASVGAVTVTTSKRPLVAVMSTGDELVAPGEPLAPGKIRDSNRPMLVAMLDELGADVADYGIVGDDPHLLRATIAKAASEADAVITSGGVSMGEYDLVKQVLEDLGDIEFWKVAMQPAKPFAFGLIEGVPLFGLPGNPVSVFVAFEQFARPALLHMMGAKRLFRQRIPGVLGSDVKTHPHKEVFLRVTVDWSAQPPAARLAGGQSSNVLSALAAADAFAVVPVGTADLGVGSRVMLELFSVPESRTAMEVFDE